MKEPPVLSWEEFLMPEQTVTRRLGGCWGPYSTLPWNLKREEVWG